MYAALWVQVFYVSLTGTATCKTAYIAESADVGKTNDAEDLNPVSNLISKLGIGMTIFLVVALIVIVGGVVLIVILCGRGNGSSGGTEGGSGSNGTGNNGDLDVQTSSAPVDATSWSLIQKYGFETFTWGSANGESYATLSFYLDADSLKDAGEWYTADAYFGKPIYVSEEEFAGTSFTVTLNELTGKTETFSRQAGEDWDQAGYIYLEDGILYMESADRVDCIFYKGTLCINKDALTGTYITSDFQTMEDYVNGGIRSNSYDSFYDITSGGCYNGVVFDSEGCVEWLVYVGD